MGSSDSRGPRDPAAAAAADSVVSRRALLAPSAATIAARVRAFWFHGVLTSPLHTVCNRLSHNENSRRTEDACRINHSECPGTCSATRLAGRGRRPDTEGARSADQRGDGRRIPVTRIDPARESLPHPRDEVFVVLEGRIVTPASSGSAAGASRRPASPHSWENTGSRPEARGFFGANVLINEFDEPVPVRCPRRRAVEQPAVPTTLRAAATRRILTMHDRKRWSSRDEHFASRR